MGNIAASASNLATFLYDSFTQFLDASTIGMITELKPLVNSWCPGCEYGMGIIVPINWNYFVTSGDSHGAILFGHAGEDWGSGCSPICGWNPAYNFSICVSYNAATGMNCSLDDFNSNSKAANYASCSLYSSVLQVVANTTLNCDLLKLAVGEVTVPRKNAHRLEEALVGMRNMVQGGAQCVWEHDYTPDATRKCSQIPACANVSTPSGLCCPTSRGYYVSCCGD